LCVPGFVQHSYHPKFIFEGDLGVVLCAQAIQKWESGTISAKAIVEERARLRLGRARARVVYNDLLQGTRPDKAHAGPIAQKKNTKVFTKEKQAVFLPQSAKPAETRTLISWFIMVYRDLSMFIMVLQIVSSLQSLPAI